jgi:tetratricopeptide (TPR) repeat protein
MRIRDAVVVVVVLLMTWPSWASEDALPRDADIAAPQATKKPAVVIDPLVCNDPQSGDCRALIEDDHAERRKRIEGLLNRAKAFVSARDTTRALADYDAALKLDPTMTDVLNTRGELRRATGDLPRALADFTAVLKIRPDHTQARDNRKSLSKEIERLGAEMAVGKRTQPKP